MELFGKKCAWCGTKLEGMNNIERMGKRFCSEEHAKEYMEQTRSQQATQSQHRGGCC